MVWDKKNSVLGTKVWGIENEGKKLSGDSRELRLYWGKLVNTSFILRRNALTGSQCGKKLKKDAESLALELFSVD